MDEKKVLTKEEMAQMMGMSVEVFDEEIKNAGNRPSLQGPNRAQRRAMMKKDRHKS